MSRKRDAYYRDPSKGAVHTPMEIARDIVIKFPASLIKAETTFFDPACGNGNLLVAVAERKLSEGYDPGVIAASLFGNDINGEAVEECKARLSELLGSVVNENFTVSDWLAN
jgi:SAM-dependent methyltransferase